MDTSYWMLRFLRSPNAAKAREVLGIGEGDDGGTPSTPGSGDVTGPASAVAGNFAAFGDTTGKVLVDGGSAPANAPTANQKAALAGTNGAPSAANPYVTNSDPRNSDSRAPNGAAGGVLSGSYPNPGFAVDMATQAELDAVDATALGHAARHSAAGADPVTITNLAGFPGGTANFLRADATFAAPPGGGSGTVTSVALTAPSIFSVAGSPVTTAGSLDLALANQNANLVFAGPSTGAAAAPTFRSLTVADIPFTASAWDTVIIKSLDQVEPENAVLQPDDELVTPVLAASLYDVELIIKYTASSTASDYSCALFYPSITQVRQCVAYQVGYIATNTSSLTTSVPAATRFPSADLARGVETVGDVHIFYVKLFIYTTGAGNLEYRFTNNSALAGSTTTTFAGSILRIKKLS